MREKEEWRCATRASGDQYLTLGGTMKMLLLLAVSWGLNQVVRIMGVLLWF